MSRSRSCRRGRRTLRSCLEDAAALDLLAARLRAADHLVDETERESFFGYLRFHTADPHGNRVEVLEQLAQA